MKSIFYDYKENVKVKIPSRERLIKRLSEYDILAELTFLSYLDLQKQSENSGDVVKYINDKAKEHNVNLNYSSPDFIRIEILIKSLMINTYAMFDDYKNNLKTDIKSLICPDFSYVSEDGLSDYERMKESLEKIGVVANIPSWLGQLENYYRLTRNSVAHNNGNDEECKMAFDQIDIDAMKMQYPIFDNKAPNSPGHLSMNDFYLYSATIKHIVNLTTIALVDKIEWKNIGEIHPKLLKKHPDGTDRRSLAVKVLNDDYGYIPSKDELDKIVENIRANW